MDRSIELKLLYREYKLWAEIKKYISFTMAAQEAYDIIFDIQDTVAPCGKQMQFKKFTLGYQLCGSVGACACAKAKAHENRLATNVERYGVAHPLGNKDVRNKRKITMEDRYGSEHPLQNITSKEKLKQTNIDRYGVEYLVQKKSVRDMGHAAIRDNIEEVMFKKSITNISRYGNAIPSRTDVIKKRTVETNLNRYGQHPSKVNRSNARDTMQLLYGVDHYTQRHIPEESLSILTQESKLRKLTERLAVPTIAINLGVDSTTVYRYCKIHKIHLPRSTFETEISSFLSEHNIIFHTNDRNIIYPLELDFLIPENNFAIEFNGLYWHSTKCQPDIDYHRKKYLQAKAQGIRLITIFENEWISRSHLVKAKILNIVNKSPRGLAARKLNVRSITSNVANDFFDRYHLQGKTGSIIYSIGAYSENELVAVMAFNKQRGTNDIELIRFCSDHETHAGIFSKMFRYAVNDQSYNEVISFADLRYSQGDVYEKNGFKLVDEIPADYRYVIRDSAVHKSSFTRSNIAKKFNIDMTNLTEKSAMEQLGIPRIYDCGKLKYTWAKPRS